ncbi:MULTISPECIES: DNA-packaging protein [unclassified Haematobacter]|uniref:DNA-packaging protein n=1 Tax=unclassified Haematobacter TaxID=2640585 RepID=UPI0025BCA64B|nr:MULTISPECIES: terminase family protein [unclassified Haematobacter]
MLHQKERQEILASLSDEQAAELLEDWRFWARPEQIAPEGDWLTWVINAGRGFGKTRAGAEWVREQVDAGRQRIALIGETYKDLVEVMCYGDSGLASVFPEHQRPKIVANPNVQVVFHTGAIALGYNATQPAQLRGPQFDAAWCDELAKWRYSRETWDMLQFGLRLGERPQALVTTTPRPIPVLKEIMADPTTVVTRGSTFDNSGNLAASFLRKIKDRYEGTRLGRQELEAEMLDDLPGALWQRDQIDAHRVKAMPDMQRIVVAVDPSGTRGQEDDGDSIGIVVAGKGVDGRGYILADRSCKLSPDGWGRRAVAAYHEFKADRIIAERNFGGAMVEHVIRTVDRQASYKEVIASRGKVARAEPVAALYEQGRISHVGAFPEMEDQMCMIDSTGFIGEGSPDRADALVWALTELMLGDSYTYRMAL